jgi:hypothetical protein
VYLIVGLGAPGQANSDASVCSGRPIEPLVGTVRQDEQVAVDISSSRRSPSARNADAAALFSIVDRSAQEKAALRIVAFGASGVGARVLFEGSFAPVSSDPVYNLAAANRERCLARNAIASLDRLPADQAGGSDVAGAIAAEIAAAKSALTPTGTATVTLLTDGCQSPAARGPNHRLTNLCAQLKKGKSTAAILRAHQVEFDLGDARGVTVVMSGVGVGRHARFANTDFAQRLVGFWRTVCTRAHARACLIESSVL